MSESWEDATPARQNRAKRTKAEDDQLPPHSLEHEQAVLACCMDEPGLVGRCIEKLPKGDWGFYDLSHRTLFEAMLELYQQRKSGDFLMLIEALKTAGKLEAAGGLAVVGPMQDHHHQIPALEDYITVLTEKSALRKLLQAAHSVIGRVKEGRDDFQTIISTSQQEVLGVIEANIPKGERKIGEQFKLIVERLESFRQGVKVMQGIPTGFNFLDNMLCGLKGAEYIALAGRPGAGKSMLAMQIAEHIAADQGIPVGVFSLEMTALGLATRQVFSRAGANLQKYRNGFLETDDIPKLTLAMEAMRHAPLYVDEVSGLTPDELAVKARRMVKEHGVKLFVIDYIQLMAGRRGKHYDNRSQELADVSMEIVKLKKELNVTFIVLAQMNREIEKDMKRKPQLSDLKDTGQIEQDADVVAFLYDADMRKAKDDPDSEEGKAQLQFLNTASVQRLPAHFRDPNGWVKVLKRTNLLVAKQRDGPTGDVQLVNIKPWLRFVDAHVPEKERGTAQTRSDGRRGEEEPI